MLYSIGTADRNQQSNGIGVGAIAHNAQAQFRATSNFTTIESVHLGGRGCIEGVKDCFRGIGRLITFVIDFFKNCFSRLFGTSSSTSSTSLTNSTNTTANPSATHQSISTAAHTRISSTNQTAPSITARTNSTNTIAASTNSTTAATSVENNLSFDQYAETTAHYLNLKDNLKEFRSSMEMLANAGQEGLSPEDLALRSFILQISNETYTYGEEDIFHHAKEMAERFIERLDGGDGQQSSGVIIKPEVLGGATHADLLAVAQRILLHASRMRESVDLLEGCGFFEVISNAFWERLEEHIHIEDAFKQGIRGCCIGCPGFYTRLDTFRTAFDLFEANNTLSVFSRMLPVVDKPAALFSHLQLIEGYRELLMHYKRAVATAITEQQVAQITTAQEAARNYLVSTLKLIKDMYQNEPIESRSQNEMIERMCGKEKECMDAFDALAKTIVVNEQDPTTPTAYAQLISGLDPFTGNRLIQRCHSWMNNVKIKRGNHLPNFTELKQSFVLTMKDWETLCQQIVESDSNMDLLRKMGEYLDTFRVWSKLNLQFITKEVPGNEQAFVSLWDLSYAASNCLAQIVLATSSISFFADNQLTDRSIFSEQDAISVRNALNNFGQHIFPRSFSNSTALIDWAEGSLSQATAAFVAEIDRIRANLPAPQDPLEDNVADELLARLINYGQIIHAAYRHSPLPEHPQNDLLFDRGLVPLLGLTQGVPLPVNF